MAEVAASADGRWTRSCRWNLAARNPPAGHIGVTVTGDQTDVTRFQLGVGEVGSARGNRVGCPEFVMAGSDNNGRGLRPVPVLWNRSLSDSTVVTEGYIEAMANTYFRPQAIVIGHLNHPPVTHAWSTSSNPATCAP